MFQHKTLSLFSLYIIMFAGLFLSAVPCYFDVIYWVRLPLTYYIRSRSFPENTILFPDDNDHTSTSQEKEANNCFLDSLNAVGGHSTDCRHDDRSSVQRRKEDRLAAKKGFRFGIYVWDSGDLVGQRALIYCQCVKCLNDDDKGEAINVTVAVRKGLCVRRVT